MMAWVSVIPECKSIELGAVYSFLLEEEQFEFFAQVHGWNADLAQHELRNSSVESFPNIAHIEFRNNPRAVPAVPINLIAWLVEKTSSRWSITRLIFNSDDVRATVSFESHSDMVEFLLCSPEQIASHIDCR